MAETPPPPSPKARPVAPDDPPSLAKPPSLAAIAIGRNEGPRLIACLDSLRAAGIARVIYVDSGSTDGSSARAAERGAQVITLDMAQPFTAARARNAGLAALADAPPDLVQMIDGDCTLDPGWIAAATDHLMAHPDLAILCGRRRERHPQASIYNRLCDREWDTPIGDTRSCGGDALARHVALTQIGGFDPSLIAGEEPDLCLRLRRAGWRIERIAAEMVLHDAAMTRFSQFWRRARRAGHAFAEGQWRHRHGPEGHYRRETARALLWGAALPALILLALPGLPALSALLAMAYPAQILRLAAREGFSRPACEAALLLTLAKFAEAQGAIGYHLSRLSNRPKRLIEYR